MRYAYKKWITVSQAGHVESYIPCGMIDVATIEARTYDRITNLQFTHMLCLSDSESDIILVAFAQLEASQNFSKTASLS